MTKLEALKAAYEMAQRLRRKDAVSVEEFEKTMEQVAKVIARIEGRKEQHERLNGSVSRRHETEIDV